MISGQSVTASLDGSVEKCCTRIPGSMSRYALSGDESTSNCRNVVLLYIFISQWIMSNLNIYFVGFVMYLFSL
jgi:hypothetical protein